MVSSYSVMPVDVRDLLSEIESIDQQIGNAASDHLISKDQLLSLLENYSIYLSVVENRLEVLILEMGNHRRDSERISFAGL
ncbi:MAG: hypothetical protein R2828_29690 [Saprospiraceae bacterium]